MKTRKIKFTAACLILLVSSAVRAQSGGDFTITQSVVAGGGGPSVNGPFEVTGTAGQHDATTATSAGGLFRLDGGFWPAPESGASPPPPCAADVTAQVTITRGGFRFNFAAGRYLQSVRLTNAGASPIQGPVSLVFDGLSGGAVLFNASGATACAQPVSPYLALGLGGDEVLSAGETVTVVLQFTNPSNQAISYDTRVLAGADR
jgi:hypothetical protein